MTTKRLIALRGKQGSGKTTTLLRVVAALQETADAVIHEEVYGDYAESDQAVVFRFGDVLVGITTRGDRIDQLMANLELFLAHSCAIIVCPTHLWGGGKTYVEEFSGTHAYALTWVRKQLADEYHSEDEQNQAQASALLSLVQSMLG